MSCASLWTDFSCKDMDKTRVYLERSKTSQIDLRLSRMGSLSPYDPFLKLVPGAIARVRSLITFIPPKYLEDVTNHLSCPTPLLKRLDVGIGIAHDEPEPWRRLTPAPTLAPTLFGGYLSSLRVLCLQSVRTELPWRNMVNLTSFTLGHMLSDVVSIKCLLDFFESAPHLRTVELRSATPTSGAQNGRLVSLACLDKMEIYGSEPPSLLLDHLLIPAGAKLATMSSFRGPPVEVNLPRSLDNLRNLSNFTKIGIHVDDVVSRMQFTGPNGEVLLESMATVVDITSLVLESLSRFDTSNTQWLRIFCSNPPSRDSPYRTLLPMENLRTLTLVQYTYPDTFIHALHPGLNHSSDVVVCPKLEELAITPLAETVFDTKSMIVMAAARASRGAKLRTVRIACSRGDLRPRDVLELRKHVLHVEFGGDQRSDDSDEVSDGSDGVGDSDEED